MSDFIIEGTLLKKYIGEGGAVVIPEGITKIAKYAFDRRCNKTVENVYLPFTLTDVHSDSFAFTHLKEVHVPDIKTWCQIRCAQDRFDDRYIFHDEYALYINEEPAEHVVVPEGVKTLHVGAFSNCCSLRSITFPSTLRTIERGVFDSCRNLREIHISDIRDWLNIEFDSFCSNPLNENTYLYVNGEPITEIVIPDGVSEIKPYAFYSYNKPLKAVIPNSVISIGRSAFEGCSALVSVNIPASLKTIESRTFSGCRSLTDVSIPSSVTCIGYAAFSGCCSLERLVIPDTVTEICKGAFGYCHSLTSISLPKGLTCIEDDLLRECISLTSVEIPLSVTAVGKNAFARCESLTDMVIPADVNRIGASAFDDCVALCAVHIADIASWCAIRFHPHGNSNPLCYAHDLYVNGEPVTHLVIPEGVTTLGARCFCGFRTFESITVPPSVTCVGEDCFRDCSSLREIRIADLHAWFGIAFQGENANPTGDNTTLLLNGVAVTEDDVRPLIAETVKKHLDTWEMRVVVRVERNFHYYNLSKSFRFTESDAVIRNGTVIGFHFFGTFVSLADAGKELPPSFVPPELIDPEGPEDPLLRYSTFMVLSKCSR